jgi:urea transport system ATP-binding protein
MLELKFVNAAYGKSQVLWDINLNVQDGEAVALMGRNGVGKTTLLRSIVGIHPVSTGRIQFGDELLFQGLPAYERARRGLAYVPQGDRSRKLTDGTTSTFGAENLEPSRTRNCL